jgi:endonuclease/exonuclease/phosphatase family metal-dependent hydrolase
VRPTFAKAGSFLPGLFFFFTGFAALAAPEEITFAGYNVENYVTTDRRGARPGGTAPKPEKEKQAVVQIIKEIAPDILGVCEMGLPEDFDDFKQRLSEAGLGYTDSEYLQAQDDERHLVLLSRFPIISRQSRTDIPFDLNGRQEKVKRGFLDVTVRVRLGYDLRLVGVHLKSKRAVEEGEALLRRHEAHLLRQHIDSILKKDPAVNLLVYGDCNETKNEPAIREITGARSSKGYMADLWLQDALGDRWTHYWRVADSYTRLDYIFVSRGLWPEVMLAKSRVHRGANWNDASDHRPVVATIRIGKQ